MKKLLSFLVLATAASLLHADQTTDEIIAKAREYLGGDAALKEITSISYEADFITGEGESGTIRIIFQKPLQQRVEVIRGDMGEVTALNDFDGWRKAYDINDEESWQLSLLAPQKIRELQANTWENLNFFRNIEKRRGRIENLGSVEVDGRATVKLIFHYPGGIEFTRFFDAETGRLLMTRTHEGAEIREEGEVEIKGIVFPETIIMSRDGQVLNEVHFRDIKVNEHFEDSLFDVPSLAR